MNIGIVSIYAYRPHVQLLFYLAELMAGAGHNISFLVCDASVSKCYSQLLKGHNKVQECAGCILGGLRSFPSQNVYEIDPRWPGNLAVESLREISLSSSYTLNRIETSTDCKSEEVLRTQQQLLEPIDIVYGNTLRWIQSENLEAVICFNGRMALTRAVTFACEQLKIPFITTERTLFGQGLLLTPNGNCLALSEVDRLHQKFSSVPLSEIQAKRAAKLAALRFLKQNSLEWRLYNSNADVVHWPSPKDSYPKILILPSSRHEIAAHEDYIDSWGDLTVAIDEILSYLDISPQSCVLRCHPNWAENIGIHTGYRSERHYVKWANKTGIYCIGSQERADTYCLMNQADIIIVNGSSCGFEGGLLGKKVICVGSANYREAGFTYQLQTKEDLDRLELLKTHNTDETVRKALRFVYTTAYRISQFTRYVVPSTTTQYQFYQGANPKVIEEIFNSGSLEADDPYEAQDTSEENPIVYDLIAQNWEALASWEETPTELEPSKVERRWALRWIDVLREQFATGDR